jgi:hypothetical protein
VRVYSELMNEEGRGGPERRANRYRVKRQSKEQRAENLKAIQKYIADAKKAEGEEKAPEIRSVDPKTGIRRQQKSSTEYEGPSLREKLSYLIAEAKKYKKMKWRPTVSQYGKKLTKGNPKGKEGDIARTRSGLAKRGTVATGKFTTAPGKPIRMKKHKKGKAYDERHPQISYTQDDKGTLTVAHTEYEGPSLSEADFASSLERLKKKNPALARHRVRTTPYPSGLSKGKEGHQQETPYTGKEKAEVQAAIKYYRKNPVLRGAAAEEARAKRKFPVKSSTEYEGPSLSEEEKDITKDPKHQARVIAKLLADRDTLRKAAQRDASPLTTARDDARQERKAQKAWTEYEGPSLKEEDDDAQTGGSYSTAAQAFKDKIRSLMNPPKGKKKLRPGVASSKEGRRRQSREAKGSGIVISKKHVHALDIDKEEKPKSQKEQLEYLASFFLNEQPRVDPKRAAMRARGVNTSVTSQVRSAETLAQGRGAMNPTQRRDMRIKFSGAQAKRTQRSWDRPGVTAAKPGQRVPSTTQGHFGNPSK